MISMKLNGRAGPGGGAGGRRFRPKKAKEQMKPPFLALAVGMKGGFKAAAA